MSTLGQLRKFERRAAMSRVEPLTAMSNRSRAAIDPPRRPAPGALTTLGLISAPPPQVVHRLVGL